MGCLRTNHLRNNCSLKPDLHTLHQSERRHRPHRRAAETRGAENPGGMPTHSAGLHQHEAKVFREWHARPAITYTQLKEWLEQALASTCSKPAMQKCMQSPFKTMRLVSIDELRDESYV